MRQHIIVGTDGSAAASDGMYDFADNIDLYKFLKQSELGDIVVFNKPEEGLREHRSGDVSNLIIQLANWWISDNTGIKDVLIGLLGGYISEFLTTGRKKRVFMRISKQKLDGSYVNIDIEFEDNSAGDIQEIVKNAID